MRIKEISIYLVILLVSVLAVGEISPSVQNSMQEITQTMDNAMNLAWGLMVFMIGSMIAMFLIRLMGPLLETRRRDRQENRVIARVVADNELRRSRSSRGPAASQPDQRRQLRELDATVLAPAQKTEEVKPAEEKPPKSRWESLE